MNLIPQRIERFKRHTTITKRDRPTEHGSSWCVDKAIQDQVNREDDSRDSKILRRPLATVLELPYESPTRLSLYRFVQGILP